MQFVLAAPERRRLPLAGRVLLICLSLSLAVPALAGPTAVPEAVQDHPALAGPEAAEGTAAADPGIAITSVRLSAGGYMLDVRYRITDPDKAARLTSHAAKPYLVDERTGARMLVPSPPKVGALRQLPRRGAATTGRTYFMLFANPGRTVKAGGTVTLVLGDLRAEHLPVQ
jgi:hypothetical protein